MHAWREWPSMAKGSDDLEFARVSTTSEEPFSAFVATALFTELDDMDLNRAQNEYARMIVSQ